MKKKVNLAKLRETLEELKTFLADLGPRIRRGEEGDVDWVDDANECDRLQQQASAGIRLIDAA